MRIPIFVKAKIVSSEEVHKDRFYQFNLKLKPEYFVKGSNALQTYEEFEVYYRRYQYVSDSVDYKIGKSYLFPLWDRGEPDNQLYAIATWISGEDSRFLIEDELLYDKNNFFNMGNKVNWNDFVERMRDMINLILNEKELEKYKMPSIYRRGK